MSEMHDCISRNDLIIPGSAPAYLPVRAGQAKSLFSSKTQLPRNVEPQPISEAQLHKQLLVDLVLDRDVAAAVIQRNV